MPATQSIPAVPADPRTRLGTRESNRLREVGRLPAVIYGHGKPATPVSVDYKQLTDLLHHHAHLLEVQVTGGASEPCLVKEVQWNHLGDRILHVDFTRTSLDERVSVEVNLEFVGDPIGLKQGDTFFEHPVTSLEIECLATQIPDSLKVDVSNLDNGDTLSASDVPMEEGFTLLTDPDTVVASVREMVEEPEPEVAEAAEGAEPEVIGEKEREEEKEEGESSSESKSSE